MCGVAMSGQIEGFLLQPSDLAWACVVLPMQGGEKLVSSGVAGGSCAGSNTTPSATWIGPPTPVGAVGAARTGGSALVAGITAEV